MNEKERITDLKEIREKSLNQANLTKRLTTSAIFIAVGVVLAFLNPFAFVEILGGPKIFPMAHFINGLMGVLTGLAFACTTSLGIAIIRYPLGIGSIHAFHGGIAGAFVVGLTAHFLRKKYPKYVEYAALTEPIGTVFIAATIANMITPVTLFYWWALFAAASIPGCILGFIMLKFLKRQGTTWQDFF
ncbi:MAG: energy coupling factor transporter S component ThiW [Candidatus Lokiarchaeota archaeon]|nr:energy coupling factor transporter S component ThiW [Candidatus Lokiarchaeota archaeon]